MQEEITRRCRVEAQDGHCMEALELRFVTQENTARDPRKRIGAKRWMLSSGEGLTVVDERNLMVIATGEWLRIMEH